MPDRPQRSIPDPGFAGDDGTVAPTVAAALAGYDAAERAGGSPDHRSALAVLQDSRVLVPVVAVLGEIEHGERGLAQDKRSDMATVLMTGADGRQALLGFTGSGPLQRWNADARPVPVSLRDAARAARHDGAAAVVLDVAGPVLFAIEGDDLAALADGLTLVDVAGRWGWVRPGPGAAGA